MANSWLEEIWRAVTIVIVAAIFGVIIGHVYSMLIVGLLGYLAWTFYNLYHLMKWLNKSKKFSPPNSVGLWGDIFTGIYRKQQRSKKRQKKLANLLARFRETTEAMPDGVVVMHSDGAIEWWNEAAGAMLDLKYPADVSQRITNLIRDPEFNAFFTRCDKDESFAFDAPADENKTIAVRFTPYGKDQTLLIVRDVTLFERVEQIRRDFVANISHELRTPLTVMTGFLETLSQDSDLDPAMLRSFELMQQQSKRMRRLVEDLMLLSKLENENKPIKHEVIIVPQLIETLKGEANILSGDKNHDIKIEADMLLYLYGDSKEIESAFTNLVVNAINYTPANGTIRVRWYEDDHGVHFEVHDTGIGIPKHHIERLTERFYRVDVARSRESGGSGLGLAIVKHAMNRHEANLRIESEVGVGSRFICDFDLACAAHKGDKRIAS